MTSRSTDLHLGAGLALALSLLVGASAAASLIPQDTEDVPLSRLLTNQLAKLSRNTNDYELTYQVARLLSLAYATNVSVVSAEVETGYLDWMETSATGLPEVVQTHRDPQSQALAHQHLTQAIALYERSLVLMRKSSKAEPWDILPAQLGLAWCLEQSGRRKPAVAAYRQALKLAWKLEVTGETTLASRLRTAWDDVRSGRNPFRSHRHSELPMESYCDEVIERLLALLDPEQDAAEIADLEKRQEVLGEMGRAMSPILIPLESEVSFDHLVDPHADVAFDLDGSGLPRRWGWITPRAAWLVYDARDTGRITSGLQLFGNVTFWIFWSDGYAALAALDDNADGQLAGPELQHLALWRDVDSDGVSDPGEVRPVTAFGIRALACRAEPSPHGFPWNPAGVRFQDGSTRPTYDWIAPSFGGPETARTAARSQ